MHAGGSTVIEHCWGGEALDLAKGRYGKSLTIDPVKLL